jgi:hydroxyacylglutathione hydrolase
MQIHRLSCGLGNAFLIDFPQGLLLIDSGSPGQHGRVLAKMKALGRRDLKVIWITHAHYDHYGSAKALRELTGAQIGVHPADAQYLEQGQSPLGTTRRYGFFLQLALPLVNRVKPLPATPPDFTLEDGETLEGFGLDATVLHTPGHTPGHTSLLLPEGIAFAGDLIAGVPKKRVQYLVATDWSQLPGSLARLQAVQPEWVYSGHSKQPMPGKVFQQIKAG